MTGLAGEITNFSPCVSAVKGFAMVLIVLCHAGMWLPLADFAFLFSVPSFIFLSGFLIKEKHLSNPVGYLLGKAKRLYVPYMLWMFVFLLLHNPLAKIFVYDDVYSWDDILSKSWQILTMQERNSLLGAFWFLKELFYASIICFVAIWATKVAMKKHYRPYYVFLYSLISMICACLYSQFPYALPTVGRQTLLTMAYFFLGYAFSSVNYKPLMRKRLALLLFAALVVISLNYNDNFNAVNWHIRDFFFVSLFGVFGTFILCHSLPENSLVIKTLSKVGKYSMPILLMQFLAFKIIDFAKVLIYGLPFDKLSDFPIILEHNSYFFIIYTFAGLLLPIFVTVLYKRVKNIIIKRTIIRS